MEEPREVAADVEHARDVGRCPDAGVEYARDGIAQVRQSRLQRAVVVEARGRGVRDVLEAGNVGADVGDARYGSGAAVEEARGRIGGGVEKARGSRNVDERDIEGTDACGGRDPDRGRTARVADVDRDRGTGPGDGRENGLADCTGQQGDPCDVDGETEVDLLKRYAAVDGVGEAGGDGDVDGNFHGDVCGYFGNMDPIARAE